eukprot:10555761-Alexandrium_andersonii.AAC.1
MHASVRQHPTENHIWQCLPRALSDQLVEVSILSTRCNAVAATISDRLCKDLGCIAFAAKPNGCCSSAPNP